MNFKNWESLWLAVQFLFPLIILIVVLAILLAFAYTGIGRYAPESTDMGFYRRMWLFGMSCAFGVTMGSFMGASQSMAAASIINVVVPLVSGYFAYLTSRDLAVEVKLFVPGAVAGLLLSLMISFWHMRFYFLPTK